MNRGDAYKVLDSRLESLRTEGYHEVRRRVGDPATSETVQVSGEDVVVEIAVVWADKKRRTLLVRATACGPSTWRMERLEESFVIGPGHPTAS